MTKTVTAPAESESRVAEKPVPMIQEEPRRAGKKIEVKCG